MILFFFFGQGGGGGGGGGQQTLFKLSIYMYSHTCPYINLAQVVSSMVSANHH